MNIGQLIYKITGDVSGLKKAKREADTQVEGLGNKFKAFGTVVKAVLATAVIAGLTSVTTELINTAARAEETRNKFNVVFRDVADEARAAAEEIKDSYGLSGVAAETFLSQVGDIVTGLGATSDEALLAADTITKLGVDIDSFANLAGGAQQAVSALTSLFTGEREAAKALGIVINETNLKQYAEDTGRVYKEMTQLEKGFLSLELAQKQSQLAIGDFQRSQASFTNQTRIAKAALEDLKVEAGQNLIPAATAAVSAIAKMTRGLADFIAERNRLKEAEKAVEEGTASYLQRILLLQQELDAQKAIGKAVEDNGYLGRKAKERALEDSNAKIAAIVAEIRALGQQAEAEAMLSEQARKAAEEERKLAEEQAARDAQALKDIEFRDAIWGQTEEARIAAIQAEIAELETFKESDIRAQQALAYLREELKGLLEDTEKQTDNLYDAEIAAQQVTDAYYALGTKGIRAANQATTEWYNNLVDTNELAKDFIQSSLAGFYNLGEAMYNGANAAGVLGSATLKAGVEILNALGAELAARAAILAIAEDYEGALRAGAASAAAFTSAGFLSAAADDLLEASQPNTPTTTSETDTGTTAPTSRASATPATSGSAPVKVTAVINLDKVVLGRAVADVANNGIVEFNI